MSDTLKKILTFGGVIAVIILIILVATRSSGKFGSTAIPGQQNPESSSISTFASESIATIGTFFMGGHNSDALARAQYASVGTCADATTTLAALVNPFSATSTAQVSVLSGQNGTTTVSLLMGTSTTAFAPVNGNLPSPTLLNIATLATSSVLYTASGVAVGSLGYIAPGTANYSISVAGGDYALLQATSSYAGSSATGLQGITNTNNTFSCTYKVLWTK